MNERPWIAKLAALLLLPFAVLTSAVAQDGTAAKDSAQKEADAKEKNGAQAILDNYFGAGIMAYGLKDSGKVKSARIVNGIVRIEEQANSQISFMLEAHKFFPYRDDNRIVHGPFIGLLMAGEGGIDTGILGWMFGFRSKGSDRAINLGFGITMTPRGQTLGDGIEENRPMPVGETEVRYKYLTKYGVGVVVSFGL